MFDILSCLAGEHDLRLVAVAGVICFFASFTAMFLFHRAKAASGGTRLRWLVVAGGATGCGIWATHFIAMLAYSPGPQIGWNVSLTLASLGAAVLLTTIGFWAAAGSSIGRCVTGGLIVAGGVAVMHFIGMSALELAGTFSWRPGVVLVAVVLGSVLSTASFWVARKRSGVSLLSAAALLTGAIVALHFVAMGAIIVHADPTKVVGAHTFSPNSLSVAVAATTLALMCMCLGGVFADHRMHLQAADHLAELEAREASFRLLFESNPVPMWVYDRESLRIIAVNQAAVDHYGYSQAEFLTLTLMDIRPAEDHAALMQRMQPDESEAEAKAQSKTWRHLKANGAEIEVAIYSTQMIYQNRACAIVASIDITERKLAEQKLQFMANNDPLTGLANRAAFSRALDERLREAEKTDKPFALLCLDLDRFKEINDLFGHPAGDELLRRVGQSLTAAAGEGVVARLGGDEFAIIVSDTSEHATASDLAQRIHAAIHGGFDFETNAMMTGTSIGVACFPGDGTDADTLIANADAALYRAKSDGRGMTHFFQPEMDLRLRELHALQRDLKVAIARKELSIQYQPQQSTDGKIFGFEALMRWYTPERGWVPPSEFIPAAERAGLIGPMGEWVLREACVEAASWSQPLGIAVNISPLQFRRPDFVEMVASTLVKTGLAPERLELELTESVMLDEPARALEVLHALKALGVSIAMDDFGTGYSSLSYLQSFPFDRIKIDRTFVSSLGRSEQSAAIVSAIIGLGRGLKLPVIAEGVETDEQMTFLLSQACDAVQGFLIGEPANISAYAHIVNSDRVAEVVSEAVVAAPSSS